MDLFTIKQKVNGALKKLKEIDHVLLEINVNERTISHKFAEYLQNEFADFSVDCEYNRHLDMKKILDVPKDPINWDDVESKTIFPDIIVHQRTNDKGNLLVIEMKKSSNRVDRQFDMSKIQAMMMTPFNYQFGLFIAINVVGGDDSLTWWEKNG